MPKKRQTKQEHDPEILRGIARGPWALSWADREEEKGRRFGGVDLYEVAPEAPRWAGRWAREVADAIVLLNDKSLDDLFLKAITYGYARDREAFGYYLGMQATGAGVRWDDDLGGSDLKIKVPSAKFYERAKPDLRFVRE